LYSISRSRRASRIREIPHRPFSDLRLYVCVSADSFYDGTVKSTGTMLYSDGTPLANLGKFPSEIVARAGKRLTSISRQLQNAYSIRA
jgi:hypothetical protein